MAGDYYDPMYTNQALQRLGSTYRVPEKAVTPGGAAWTAGQPLIQPTSAPAGAGAAPESGGMGGAMNMLGGLVQSRAAPQAAGSGMSPEAEAQAKAKQESMAKIGKIASLVANFYTGGMAGAAMGAIGGKA